MVIDSWLMNDWFGPDAMFWWILWIMIFFKLCFLEFSMNMLMFSLKFHFFFENFSSFLFNNNKKFSATAYGWHYASTSGSVRQPLVALHTAAHSGPPPYAAVGCNFWRFWPLAFFIFIFFIFLKKRRRKVSSFEKANYVLGNFPFFVFLLNFYF